MSPAPPPSKRWAHCGRSFDWRKKWARDWEHVRCCSDACRRGVHPVDDALDALALSLLSQRSAGGTICPSEVARAASPGDWRPLMPRVHEAVARLEARGRIDVTQGGVVVKLDATAGAYRIRARPSAEPSVGVDERAPSSRSSRRGPGKPTASG